MLFLGSSFGKFPLLSLRTGRTSGSIVGHLINPHKLRVDALWCKPSSARQPKLLLTQDIREVSIRGVIIDDDNVLSEPDELIRLRPVIDLHFELIDKKVISGRFTIGKVVDYALECDGFTVQKLYVEPALWNKFKSSRLTIDRSQILEVSHKYIKVKSGEIRADERTKRSVAQPKLSSSPSFNASLTKE